MILNDLDHPIIQAPLAGGPSTPELTAAVGRRRGPRLPGRPATRRRPRSGGDPPASAADRRAVRRQRVRPRRPPRSTAPACSSYLERLQVEADRYGVEVGEAGLDDDEWGPKLDRPSPRARPGRLVHVRLPAGRGDRLAPRHRRRGMGDGDRPRRGARRRGRRRRRLGPPGDRGGRPPGDLRRSRRSGGARHPRPAAPRRRGDRSAAGRGGRARRRAGDRRRPRRRGEGGPARDRFPAAPEAGTHPAHREALAEEEPTALTRAFTGRLARGIVNRFLIQHTDAAPIAYPQVHHATAPIRAAARERGDADGFNLWAGQAHTLAKDLPAAEIVQAPERGRPRRARPGRRAARPALGRPAGAERP